MLNKLFTASDKPTFKIIKKPTSKNKLEVPLIKVTFANGVEDHFDLKHYNPGIGGIGCNYLGRLMNDVSSSVAVTGCLDKPGDSMEITMLTKLSKHFMFMLDYYGNAEVIGISGH